MEEEPLTGEEEYAGETGDHHDAHDGDEVVDHERTISWDRFESIRGGRISHHARRSRAGTGRARASHC